MRATNSGNDAAVAEEQRTEEQGAVDRREIVERITRDQLPSREESLRRAYEAHDTSSNWGYIVYKTKALLFFLDEKLANLFGLNDSKFQWYVDERKRLDREEHEKQEEEAESGFKSVSNEQGKLEEASGST